MNRLELEFDYRMKEAVKLAIKEQNKLLDNNRIKTNVKEAINKIEVVLESLGAMTDEDSLQSIFTDGKFGAINIKLQEELIPKLNDLHKLKNEVANGKILKVDKIDELIEKYPNLSKDFLYRCGKQSIRKYPSILANVLIDYFKEKGELNKANPKRQEVKEYIEQLFNIILRDGDLSKYKEYSNLSLTPPFIFYYKKN